MGYTVLEAANGREALDRAAAFDGTIDLLLTDVIMPGMQGPALAERLAESRPSLKTLFVSGFPQDSIVREGVGDADVNYLPKPFSAEALSRAVRSVLDGAG